MIELTLLRKKNGGDNELEENVVADSFPIQFLFSLISLYTCKRVSLRLPCCAWYTHKSQNLIIRVTK